MRREDDVLVCLVRDEPEVVALGEIVDRLQLGSESTAPVGLCGVLRKIAIVRGVIAASMSAARTRSRPRAESRTPTVTPPASRMFSATSVHIGSGMITSSPGESSAPKVT